MFLLYADESGTPGGADQEHFILAGVTVFERKAHWLSLELDKIASRFNPQDPNSVELHGAPMLAGRKLWRKFPKEARLNAIKDALNLIDGKHYKIIASIVKKQAISPEDPVHYTFQQLITRFDHFLTREHLHFKNTQRGLVLFDKSSKEAPIQALATEFKTNGHEWGNLRNMAEVPVFVDSTATRLIQLADLVAYALFRKYEKNDPQFSDIIEKKFDYFGGVQHGLHLAI
ncbi:DUF3800 domain-containing protein [Catenovulum sp. 2E275]|uniref:DUF3800 domain-containing protein n=1 Tax=Catenovulum sp. 2E275 TaxID=2980497 RepID=UPI0021D2FEBA|nr:DUF3800 domain-containing protein [Catenovulum sp. 2E275]MCU4674101.1 DUF3800 domain-containing protein [Catenovulum sp. 2E275]